MRAMNIRVFSGKGGLAQLKASFHKNWPHYLQEALGLAIFMISACCFGGLLWGFSSPLHVLITNELVRWIIMGVFMGATALFIFYSSFTAPSGAHINPAVTIAFLRVGGIGPCDALFYIIFQFLGGLLAVYVMALLMGRILTAPPVNYVVTVPGKYGIVAAAITEYLTAFIMMGMVLLTSARRKWKKYTRLLAGCLVCAYVIIAGPISGFGMNPARSFASALPAGIWTAFWIYAIVPLAGMWSVAELSRNFVIFRDQDKPGIS